MQEDRLAASVTQATFLESINQRIAEANAALYKARERLSDRGFYGPPEQASNTGDGSKAPQENNLRSEIATKLMELEHYVANITYQIERLA